MDSRLKAQMSPSLGLLTIANMLQDKHTIIYENENTAPINYDEKVDIVGISIKKISGKKYSCCSRRYTHYCKSRRNCQIF